MSDSMPAWLPWVVGINLILTLAVLVIEIWEHSTPMMSPEEEENFRVSRWYARLRRQGNPYLDFPIIRAPTVKFPDF